MALDDFTAEESSDDTGNNTEHGEPETAPHTLLRAVDYHIMEHSEHLDLETNTIPENPTLHVSGDVIIADRTRLSAAIAVAISNFDSDDVKSLEELSMAEIQKK